MENNDLDQFGTELRPPRNFAVQDAGMPRQAIFNPIEGLNKEELQWAVRSEGVHEICGRTENKLPKGSYSIALNPHGIIQFVRKDMHTDELLWFQDSLPESIFREIKKFISPEQKQLFHKYGYLHRRGYLFYGPQGSGKSAMVRQIIEQVSDAGGISFFVDDPDLFIKGMAAFRHVEPGRTIVAVLEDIDAIVNRWSDSSILQWLDGFHQIDNVINIATTNYPERLDRRLVGRPRRFDRVIRIDYPSIEIRRQYLLQRLPDCDDGQIELMAKETQGISFAGLSDLIISVFCLGNTLESTLKNLRSMERNHPSSSEFKSKFRSVGFGQSEDF